MRATRCHRVASTRSGQSRSGCGGGSRGALGEAPLPDRTLSDQPSRRLHQWRHVLRATRERILAFADRALLLASPRVPRHGIAIILPHGLGDLVLYTPTFHHLRAHYGDQPILLICSRRVRTYAETYLTSDRIIAFDRDRMRRDLWYRMRIVSAVARAGVRIAIQPAYNRV